MVELHKLKVSELKAMIRYYNLHVIVKGYSKLNKTELINLLNQYMDNGPSSVSTKSIDIPLPTQTAKIIKSKKAVVIPVEEVEEEPEIIEPPKRQPPEVPYRRFTRSSIR